MPAGLRINEHLPYPGEMVFRHACKLGLEGIVSKPLGSRYRSGRPPDWLKFKNPERAAREAWGRHANISVDGHRRSSSRSPARSPQTVRAKAGLGKSEFTTVGFSISPSRPRSPQAGSARKPKALPPTSAAAEQPLPACSPYMPAGSTSSSERSGGACHGLSFKHRA